MGIVSEDFEFSLLTQKNANIHSKSFKKCTKCILTIDFLSASKHTNKYAIRNF